MLKNSKLLNIISKRKKDFWTEEALDWNLEEVQAWLNQKINDGYSLYNMTTEGNSFGPLAGKTAGKWIIVWTNDPSGTYQMNQTITSGWSGVQHTDVIITGIKLGAGMTSSIYNVIGVKPVGLSVETATTGYKNIISLQYGSFSINNGLGIDQDLKGLYFKNCNLSITNRTTANKTVTLQNDSASSAIPLLENVNCTLYTMNDTHFNIIHTGNTAGNFAIRNTVINQQTNNTGSQWVYLKGNTAGTGYYFNAKNTKFLGNFSIYSGITYGFSNCLFGYSLFGLNGKLDIVSSVSYANNTVNIPSLLSLTGYTKNYTFVPYKEYQVIVDGKNRLDHSVIAGLNTTSLEMNADIRYTRKTIKGILGTVKRNYYSINFRKNTVIDDSLKNFDDMDYFLVWRKDLEAEFTNFGTDVYTDGYNIIYNNAIVNYTNDESLLILIEDTSNQYGYNVVAYHKGKINTTVFGQNLIIGSTYKMKRIFQIFEFPEEVSVSNAYNIDDAPLDASITVQDITSKVVR